MKEETHEQELVESMLGPRANDSGLDAFIWDFYFGGEVLPPGFGPLVCRQELLAPEEIELPDCLPDFVNLSFLLESDEEEFSDDISDALDYPFGSIVATHRQCSDTYHWKADLFSSGSAVEAFDTCSPEYRPISGSPEEFHELLSLCDIELLPDILPDFVDLSFLVDSDDEGDSEDISDVEPDGDAETDTEVCLQGLCLSPLATSGLPDYLPSFDGLDCLSLVGSFDDGDEKDLFHEESLVPIDCLRPRAAHKVLSSSARQFKRKLCSAARSRITCERPSKRGRSRIASPVID